MTAYESQVPLRRQGFQAIDDSYFKQLNHNGTQEVWRKSVASGSTLGPSPTLLREGFNVKWVAY